MLSTNIGFAPETFLDFKECCNVRGNGLFSLLCKLYLEEFVPIALGFQVLHAISSLSKNFRKDYAGIYLNVPYS